MSSAALAPSDGLITVIPGIVLISAMSSKVWWLAPSSPTVIPAWVAQIFTFACVYPMEFLIISKALPAANIAKVLAHTTFPERARPHAAA